MNTSDKQAREIGEAIQKVTTTVGIACFTRQYTVRLPSTIGRRGLRFVLLQT
jgi:hypothetical protein